MSVVLMPVSFSRLSTFESCEAKFEHLYVNKTVKDADNEFTIYGSRIHESLEKYGKAVQGNVVDEALAALDDYAQEVQPFLPLVDKILRQQGEKHFEFQMALTKDLTPCDWFAPDVWLRGIADVLVINGTKAFCIDWKTGKVKDNPTQLQLFAAMVFAHFPEVQEVKAMFVWLAHNQTSDAIYHRNKVEYIWNAMKPRFNKIQDAVDIGVFKAKPSPLCKWCPARAICGDAR